MRDNSVKAKLMRGEPSFGTMAFEFFVPGLPQIAKAAGAEFVLFDMEHSGLGFETLKQLIAACRGIGLVPMCRVPAGQYHFIARALDIGAMGIMVPMVGSAEEAAHVVSCTRYPPQGRRGAAFGFAHDDYEPGGVAEKMRAANERTLVMALIETEEGIRDVQGIAAVPGLDVLWLGHFDLTNFLGIPAQFGHPKYVRSLERLTAAARRHGKVLACMSADEAWSRQYWELGFRLFAAGIDAHLLQSALRQALAPLQAAAGASAPRASVRPATGKPVAPKRSTAGRSAANARRSAR
jgi:2-dehydro-3-deoxyglucarate aldolase/4-hydroxy-2-oxoheptanedioate aldolase